MSEWKEFEYQGRRFRVAVLDTVPVFDIWSSREEKWVPFPPEPARVLTDHLVREGFIIQEFRFPKEKHNGSEE